MPILGLCRTGSRLYTFGVVPPCSAGPIATVAPAHRGWFVANPDTRFGVTSGWPVIHQESGFERNVMSAWRFSPTMRKRRCNP
jgi:hypothetical protein